MGRGSKGFSSNSALVTDSGIEVNFDIDISISNTLLATKGAA